VVVVETKFKVSFGLGLVQQEKDGTLLLASQEVDYENKIKRRDDDQKV
jgi:hypothetical protein